MTDRRIRVCLYSPADLNLVSGSSIWVRSVAETLSSGPAVEVTVPLRCRPRRDLITGPLARRPRVELVDPRRQRRFVPPQGLTMGESLDLIERLDRERPFDAILLRSLPYCLAAVDRPRLRDRLWSCYILEPERDPEDRGHLEDLARIAEGSHFVVAQSEEMRALFEGIVPAGRGKTIILPPAVPPLDPAWQPPAAPVQRLLYAGKFHPFYPVDRMVEFLVELRSSYPRLELHVAGDQVYRPYGDHAYADRLERALSETPGVVRHGALSREATGALLSAGGIALSLWDYRHGSTMNDLVVSTKLLDYCAAGVPVIVNRTLAQETILGPDYPLFVRSVDEALPLLRALLADPDLYREAALRSRAAARRFEYPAVFERLAPYLEGQPGQALRDLERPKLEGAQLNVGALLGPEATAVPDAALEIAAALHARDPRFRLLVGREASSGPAPEAGADPAAALRDTLPPALRPAVSTRTVDDPANWWRTIGFVVPSGVGADAALRAACASGAVPLGLARGHPSLLPSGSIHATPAAAADGALRLLHEGRWGEASQQARDLAFGRGEG